MNPRDGTEADGDLDRMRELCERTGLSLLMLYPASGDAERDGLEPLIAKRQTIEHLVSGFQGRGLWVMCDGKLCKQSEPRPLWLLGEHF